VERLNLTAISPMKIAADDAGPAKGSGVVFAFVTIVRQLCRCTMTHQGLELASDRRTVSELTI